jgi:hypothetical protein
VAERSSPCGVEAKVIDLQKFAFLAKKKGNVDVRATHLQASDGSSGRACKPGENAIIE